MPAKVAKGGAASNRIYRLLEPESVIEYFVVGVAPYTPPVPPCADDAADVTCGTAASSLLVHCEDAANNCGTAVSCASCAYGTCGPKAYSGPVSTASCVTTAECLGGTMCVVGRCVTPYNRSCLCQRATWKDAACQTLGGVAFQNLTGTTGCASAGCTPVVGSGTYCCP